MWVLHTCKHLVHSQKITLAVITTSFFSSWGVKTVFLTFTDSQFASFFLQKCIFIISVDRTDVTEGKICVWTSTMFTRWVKKKCYFQRCEIKCPKFRQWPDKGSIVETSNTYFTALKITFILHFAMKGFAGRLLNYVHTIPNGHKNSILLVWTHTIQSDIKQFIYRG